MCFINPNTTGGWRWTVGWRVKGWEETGSIGKWFLDTYLWATLNTILTS